VRADISAGLGLSTSVISPVPSEGTLFSNVTSLISKIAFRKDKKRLQATSQFDVSNDLMAWNASDWKVTTLLEKVTASKDRFVTLQSDFVEFRSPQSANSHLLVYSVLDSKFNTHKLITAFPVVKGFVDGILDPKKLGNKQPIKTRYNAFVDGVSGEGKEWIGSREVVQ
jgi:hypothetical protein